MSDHDDSKTVARLRELGVQIDALRTSEGWQAWLRTARKFHHYSMGNQLLIGVQRPDATHVAGYRRWQELGRQVRKGEKGIVIISPRRRKNDDGEWVVTGFGTSHVFDIAQTDGEPLPDEPAWPILDEAGHVAYADLVVQATATTGLDIWTPLPTEGPLAARGWITLTDGRLAVRDRLHDGTPLTDTARVTVLLHELGHFFDPHITADACRASKELVAESVAWLAAADLGIDAGEEAAHYLASWDADVASLLAAGKRILTAYTNVRGALTASLEPAESEAA